MGSRRHDNKIGRMDNRTALAARGLLQARGTETQPVAVHPVGFDVFFSSMMRRFSPAGSA